MPTLMIISTIFSFANLLLIVSLLYVYGGNYAKTHSTFVLGLLMFAILFLLQNIVALYSFITMMPYINQEFEIFIMIFSILQTLAFAMLAWVTWS